MAKTKYYNPIIDPVELDVSGLQELNYLLQDIAKNECVHVIRSDREYNGGFIVVMSSELKLFIDYLNEMRNT